MQFKDVEWINLDVAVNVVAEPCLPGHLMDVKWIKPMIKPGHTIRCWELTGTAEKHTQWKTLLVALD